MPSQPPEFYDEVYRERVIGSAREAHFVERRLKHVRPLLVGDVLDLGCGLGTLAESAPGRYVGVDWSGAAIEHAKASGQGDFVLEDVRVYAFAEEGESFDTVVLSEIVEHLEDDDRADLVREAKRIARQRVVLTVPHNCPDPSHVKTCWSREDVTALVGPVETEDIRGHWLAVWEREKRVTQLSEVKRKKGVEGSADASREEVKQ